MKYQFELITFISGAVVMVLELCGSRLLAPYVGTSIFVWASLIVAVLGSMSLGYYLGGVWSDRQPNPKNLILILSGAALAVLLIYLTKDWLLMYIQVNSQDIQSNAILSALALFTPINILLGMVSPYCVRLKIENVDNSGTRIGSFSAISTLGSIVGTILAGFYLIPSFGLNVIIIALGLLLVLTSFLIGWKYLLFPRIILVVLLLVASNFYVSFKNLVSEVNTAYSRAFITQNVDINTNRPTRNLAFDLFGIHSAIFTDKDDELVGEYLKYYRLADHFKTSGMNRSLMIGGGAFVFPRYFLKEHPQSTIDVVEIDPQLVGIAKQYFNLEEDPRMQIFAEDGRTFLNTHEAQYDAAFLDMFGSNLTIPYQMTTKETIQEIDRLLAPDGVAFMNIISSIEGDTGQFLQVQYATFKTIFPTVLLFPIQYPDQPEKVQNIILVALKSNQYSLQTDSPVLQEYLGHLYTKEVPASQFVFTDDYAPVEFLTYQIHKGR